MSSPEERRPLLPSNNTDRLSLGSASEASEQHGDIHEDLNSLASGADPAQDIENEESVPAIYRLLKKVPLAGFILVVLACVMMTLAGVIVKLLEDTDPFVLTAYRNCIIFLCSLPRLLWYRLSPEPEGKKKLLFLRAILSAIYSASLFYSFRYMPLGDARTISATHPIFVTLLACAFLNEPCGIFETLSLFVTVIGMVIVMHPPFIFGSHGDCWHDSLSGTYDKQYFIAAAFAAFGTLCQAGGFVATRSVKDVDFSVISAWNGFFGMFPPLAMALATGGFQLPPGSSTLPVFLVGFLSYLGQTLMILALQVEEAGTVSLVRKADDILLAFIIQIFYFDQIPDTLATVGSVMITLAVLVSGARKIIAKKSRNCAVRRILCLPVFAENENEDH